MNKIKDFVEFQKQIGFYEMPDLKRQDFKVRDKKELNDFELFGGQSDS
jgi:hypothetical protein